MRYSKATRKPRMAALKKLFRLAAEKQMRDYELADLVGVHFTTVSGWRQGGMPTGERWENVQAAIRLLSEDERPTPTSRKATIKAATTLLERVDRLEEVLRNTMLELHETSKKVDKLVVQNEDQRWQTIQADLAEIGKVVGVTLNGKG